MNRALTIPERTVDRFQDAYKDEREKDKARPEDDEDRDAPR
jgi:hypothetical protein